MQDLRHHTSALTQDVPAVTIPDGGSLLLKEGERVTVQQYLGGSFTVITEAGYYMARVDGKYAEAMGIELDDEEKPLDPATLVDDPADHDDVEIAVWEMLRTCYDPEIPVNIVELGLIYECDVLPTDVPNEWRVAIIMTLTAPGCGMGPILQGDVEYKTGLVPGVVGANVDVVFDPPWNQDMLSEAAKLELGLW